MALAAIFVRAPSTKSQKYHNPETVIKPYKAELFDIIPFPTTPQVETVPPSNSLELLF